MEYVTSGTSWQFTEFPLVIKLCEMYFWTKLTIIFNKSQSKTPVLAEKRWTKPIFGFQMRCRSMNSCELNIFERTALNCIVEWLARFLYGCTFSYPTRSSIYSRSIRLLYPQIFIERLNDVLFTFPNKKYIRFHGYPWILVINCYLTQDLDTLVSF